MADKDSWWQEEKVDKDSWWKNKSNNSSFNKKIIKVDLFESVSRDVYKVIIYYCDDSKEVVNKDKINNY